MTDYQALVNEKFAIEVNLKNNLLDAIETADAGFHILHEGKSYRATIVATDFANKKITIRVNGSLYVVQLSDKYEQMVKELGLAVAAQAKMTSVKAPMPGLVLSIAVEEGQSVKRGEAILILEAMKMENIIKAAEDCVIKKIAISKGAAVEKGQLLIELA